MNVRNFIEHYNLHLEDIYKKFSFNRLCVESGVKENYANPNEKEITKAFSRLLHINSKTWINFIIKVLVNIEVLEEEALHEKERRMLLMFHYIVWLKAPVDLGFNNLKEEKIDVFFVTLNKSEKDYSPSTMYEDYAISENLFHWQSQSTTSVESPTGQRYINHRKTGNKILLFVCEYKNENGMTSGYYFLGTANYVSHSGDRPISFTFKLDHDMPMKLLNKASKVI